MKKYLPFLSLALLAVACNTKPEDTGVKTLQRTQQNPAMDTAGLAQFQQWKAQSELIPSAEPEQTQNKPPAEAAPVKTVEVVREVRVVERPVLVRKKETLLQKEPAPTKPTDQTLPTTDNTTAANSGSGSAQSTGSTETKAPAAGQETAKKEGWSKAAKGATIGGAGGAVIGTVINKRNPAVGAVIGGVLGGAVGYGLGHNKDKKDGRN